MYLSGVGRLAETNDYDTPPPNPLPNPRYPYEGFPLPTLAEMSTGYWQGLGDAYQHYFGIPHALTKRFYELREQWNTVPKGGYPYSTSGDTDPQYQPSPQEAALLDEGFALYQQMLGYYYFARYQGEGGHGLFTKIVPYIFAAAAGGAVIAAVAAGAGAGVTATTLAVEGGVLETGALLAGEAVGAAEAGALIGGEAIAATELAAESLIAAEAIGAAEAAGAIGVAETAGAVGVAELAAPALVPAATEAGISWGAVATKAATSVATSAASQLLKPSAPTPAPRPAPRPVYLSPAGTQISEIPFANSAYPFLTNETARLQDQLPVADSKWMLAGIGLAGVALLILVAGRKRKDKHVR